MPPITIQNDPFVAWNQLRDQEPVHWDSNFDGWIISRYADVFPLVRNSKALGQAYKQTQYHLIAKNESEEAAKERVFKDSPSSRLTQNWMRFSDAPRHPRMRELIVKALPYRLFKPTNVENLRPQIEKHINDLIDKVKEHHQMDVMTSLAIPLPVRTQATIVANAPAEDFEKLVEPLLNGFFNSVRYPYQMDYWTEEAVERSHQAATKIEAYFTGLIEERRKNPQDDFISRLLAAQQEDNTLTDSDILQWTVETCVCGIHETNMALLGDGIYLLLSSGQFDLLKEKPELASKAVEEVLRYHTPSALVPRIAKEDLEVGGKTIKAGQLVFLNLASANRDPERFPDPDRFDITRDGEDNGELAFGSGAHACHGRPLIRFVAQVFYETVARRLPNLKLQQWPENGQYALRYQDRSDLYLLESLPVTF